MDIKTEIYTMWQIQENLLQQYRSMAITLFSLMLACILVFLSYFYDHHGDISLFRDPHYINAMGLMLIVSMHIMGIWGLISFKIICDQRARFVTFFQNLLLAAESGNLKKIIEKHKIENELCLMSIFRNIDRVSIPMPYESGNKYKDFISEILIFNSMRSAPKRRHYAARDFISKYFFRLFYILFVFTALITSAMVWFYISAK